MHKIKRLTLVRSYPVMQALPMIQTDIKEIKLYTLKQHELCSSLEFAGGPSKLAAIDFGPAQCVSSVKPVCYYNANLRSLSININENFDMDLDPLMTLKELTYLRLGFLNIDCIDLNQTCRLWFVLLSLTGLKHLHIKNCFQKNFDILKIVGHMPNLEALQLSGFLVDKTGLQVNLKENLTYCKNIKKLDISITGNLPNFSNPCTLGSFNSGILKGIQGLQSNLTHVKLNFHSFISPIGVIVPVDHHDQVVYYSTLEGLKTKICNMLPNTKVEVESKPFRAAFRSLNCLMCDLNKRLNIICKKVRF